MNLKVGDTVKITIDSLGRQGEGVANHQGLALYIDGALPNEVVLAKITECHKSYCRALLVEILEASPDRVQPPCTLFGRCGGCQIMHLKYSTQLELKTERVRTAFQNQSLAVKVLPCLPSPLPLEYRNKIQLPVEKDKLGLYAKSSHELIDIDTCPVHSALGNVIFQKLKPIVLSAPELRIRHLLIKTSIHLQEALVTLIAEESDPTKFEKVANQIMLASPHIKGVVLNVNREETNVILGETFYPLKGSPTISEQLGDLSFKISPASFFQVNTLQAEAIYHKVLELSGVKSDETVLDAYAGVGTIALFFARHARHVIGIECVPEAIEDAKKNALANEISNAEFHVALAENFFPTLQVLDILILNPPRKGCAESLIQAVKRLLPKKIIYISCDPNTLARDIAHLPEYHVAIVQPYDMFPQTTHVETVVKLDLKV